MQAIKNLLSKIAQNDNVKRVAHTFWQAAIGALIAGLLAVHSTADVKAVLFTAITTGLAAVKALYVNYKS